ncbi:MAG: helicase C-terminal domain-containing protein [Candidatus Marinimicrobia bacterium]|nr:helicase C-terminal domain-containing protein [Candidatus Neomarinimicrobiota bacterium]MDD5539143.1 helicase C-terminal domain-containing protein [Candidatus Neomarinimicrobiota bacterium]
MPDTSLEIDSSLGLPAKYTRWREDQYRAVQAVVKSDKPVFLGDFPTGSGKSLLSIGAHRILSKQCIYLTNTKQLQNQIMDDFGDIAVSLKGKANYPCVLKYDQFPEVSADDCAYSKPSRCDRYNECPYYLAKAEAKIAPLVVLNNAYFLNEANGDFSTFGETDFLVVDEVDSLDMALLSYIEFTITLNQIQKYGLRLPSNPDAKQSWMNWIPGVLDSLTPWVREYGEQLSRVNPKEWGPMEIELQRQVKKTEKMMGKLSFLRYEVDDSWVFYSRKTNGGDTEWVFKPVAIGKYGYRYLWSHGERSLGMSGTIFDPGITCVDLGIDDCDYMKLDSPFPVEHRPIFYKPVVNLTWKTMDYELPILAQEIDSILEKYSSQKVLIHTVSYKVRDYLLVNLKEVWRLVTHDSKTREQSLTDFKNTKEPVVMLSPSFDRGVDLPEADNVGAVVVCKMPFLSLGDPQVAARMKLKDGGKWYALKTVQTLVQGTGRHIRSKKQRGDTWILDSQFGRLRRQLADVLPGWWLKAIIDVPLEKRPD